MVEESSHTKQMIGSFIAAVLLVVLTIAIVTANLGEGLDPEELEERQERIEERREERQERLEEMREGREDGRGPG